DRASTYSAQEPCHSRDGLCSLDDSPAVGLVGPDNYSDENGGEEDRPGHKRQEDYRRGLSAGYYGLLLFAHRSSQASDNNALHSSNMWGGLAHCMPLPNFESITLQAPIDPAGM